MQRDTDWDLCPPTAPNCQLGLAAISVDRRFAGSFQTSNILDNCLSCRCLEDEFQFDTGTSFGKMRCNIDEQFQRLV